MLLSFTVLYADDSEYEWASQHHRDAARQYAELARRREIEQLLKPYKSGAPVGPWTDTPDGPAVDASRVVTLVDYALYAEYVGDSDTRRMALRDASRLARAVWRLSGDGSERSRQNRHDVIEARKLIRAFRWSAKHRREFCMHAPAVKDRYPVHALEFLDGHAKRAALSGNIGHLQGILHATMAFGDSQMGVAVAGLLDNHDRLLEYVAHRQLVASAPTLFAFSDDRDVPGKGWARAAYGDEPNSRLARAFHDPGASDQLDDELWNAGVMRPVTLDARRDPVRFVAACLRRCADGCSRLSGDVMFHIGIPPRIRSEALAEAFAEKLERWDVTDDGICVAFIDGRCVAVRLASCKEATAYVRTTEAEQVPTTEVGASMRQAFGALTVCPHAEVEDIDRGGYRRVACVECGETRMHGPIPSVAASRAAELEQRTALAREFIAVYRAAAVLAGAPEPTIDGIVDAGQKVYNGRIGAAVALGSPPQSFHDVFRRR